MNKSKNILEYVPKTSFQTEIILNNFNKVKTNIGINVAFLVPILYNMVVFLFGKYSVII